MPFGSENALAWKAGSQRTAHGVCLLLWSIRGYTAFNPAPNRESLQTLKTVVVPLGAVIKLLELARGFLCADPSTTPSVAWLRLKNSS